MEPISFAVIGIGATVLRICSNIRKKADSKRIQLGTAYQTAIRSQYPHAVYVPEEPARIFLTREEQFAVLNGDAAANQCAVERMKYIHDVYFPKCQGCNRPIPLR